MTKQPTLRSMAAASALPRLEFQMLWEHILQVPRVWLIAHDTDPISAPDIARFEALQERRLAGEPMAYILGYREFLGRRFKVGPSVLIPRPETELLVEVALRHLETATAPYVLDLGTGTGAIAISIALARTDAQVVASDVDAGALRIAHDNARDLNARVEFFAGSWYDALLDSRGFDLIVSNPPYIAADDIHLRQGDLRYEPRCALTDGHDGLTALGSIVSGAVQRLRPGGALFMEHGWDQAAQVRQLLQEAGFAKIESLRDLAGIERVSGGIYL
ncbi:peptide chain release factor N(5)-glutamine methyltransferase [Pollutimonas thiosulfatoxidans]|uniref:Release factor glutamine methyltransferase n=1 Tax=Pollutimonas thiosulfatoxidans TaxID=2028345 RepID=A0A410GDN2_9BURK|nr:peptide chain release factor N(5)-glutamine methyltransferase [Pollutimonas thiosulfatoxidans]QAA94379.1 protein-(glutamine-N5) methyltransferase, release factor-specific [Pollutimonas thiosulfatoxidans]